METKKNSVNQHLLSHRKETLKKAAFTSIQPRGKYFGFDVFTWLDAPVESLFATLDSMPYPIHWVVSSTYLNILAENGIQQFTNVAKVYIMGDPNVNFFPGDFVVCNDIKEVLSYEELGQTRGALVLTLLGSEGLDTINELCYYLKAIQGQ
jgi:hypothetical protein